MSNTRQIQPISTWTPDGEKEISVLAVSNFYDYHFDNGSGKIEYKLISVNPQVGATEHFTGVVEIPSSIVQQWGADDEPIFQYVAQTLGLIIV